MKSGKAQKVNPPTPAQRFRSKLLTANLTVFPGDISRFEDEILQQEGVFDEFRKLQLELENQSVFNNLSEGLGEILPPVTKNAVYRWFCLNHLQNKLRAGETEMLKQELKTTVQENWRLWYDITEGAIGVFMAHDPKRKDVSESFLPQKVERARQEYRKQKTREAGEREKSLREDTRHRVTHIFNSWDAMPPVSEQMAMPGSRTNRKLITARFLLKPGRKYEEAVKTFQPYDKVKEPNPEAREAGRTLVSVGRDAAGCEIYIYVNNRLEGNALETIDAMLGD